MCTHVPRPGAETEVFQEESRGDGCRAGPKEWEEALRQNSELCKLTKNAELVLQGKKEVLLQNDVRIFFPFF